LCRQFRQSEQKKSAFSGKIGQSALQKKSAFSGKIGQSALFLRLCFKTLRRQAQNRSFAVRQASV